ncbi:hypothetical protein CFOL_v3_09790 [Cephalotus follicularis]|uniref:DUF1645 domain-containing protein n=1 Tax=Cephalotus follicularis TaxID=3775 RepID=A0A1Q3BE47_CEPFO|nr:hypothetical protein CFOL_v3_09790 [Cephalotus follicularis]
MAIDVCSEISSAGISPRISFSHDLNQSGDVVAIEDDHHRLDSALLDSDFDFCIGSSFAQELSSADELFSNGTILPVEIHKKVQTKLHIHQPESAPSRPQQITEVSDNTPKKRLKELLSIDFDEDDDKQPAPKSFWQFKRSTSLNCDSTRSKGLIRSLHFLSRSHSTGSTPNPKPSKESQKHHLQRQSSVSSGRKSSVSSIHNVRFSYNSSQKPPLKKCGSYGNGVHISPVLNLPPPYISNATVSFFGFGSLFCNGKVKKKR